MKPADLITLTVVLGAMTLAGLDKIDVETLLALVTGVVLRNPLARDVD